MHRTSIWGLTCLSLGFRIWGYWSFTEVGREYGNILCRYDIGIRFPDSLPRTSKVSAFDVQGLP